MSWANATIPEAALKLPFVKVTCGKFPCLYSKQQSPSEQSRPSKSRVQSYRVALDLEFLFSPTYLFYTLFHLHLALCFIALAIAEHFPNPLGPTSLLRKASCIPAMAGNTPFTFPSTGGGGSLFGAKSDASSGQSSVTTSTAPTPSLFGSVTSSGGGLFGGAVKPAPSTGFTFGK